MKILNWVSEYLLALSEKSLKPVLSTGNFGNWVLLVAMQLKISES